MVYRLAIFDFDGTLADTFPLFLNQLNGVAERYNFRRTAPDEVEPLRHLSARELMRHLGIRWWKLPFITRHVRHILSRDIDSVPLFPGVAAMLDSLNDAGIVLAIVSSNTEPNIRRALGPDTAKLIRHFACRASTFGKPAKLRRVLKESGILKSQAIAIGDEIRDLEAAHAVGLAFGGVSWGFTHPDALARRKAEALFTTPADIKATLLSGRTARG